MTRTIQFFERKGKVRLKRDDRERVWYQDFLDFVKEDMDRLKRHYSEEEILEIVAVIALFGCLNRWNDTLKTEIETEPAAAVKKT